MHKLVVIGNDCIFGEGVKVYDHNHVFNLYSKPIYKSGFSCKPVEIEDNCWIGSNVVILPGTKVGKGSVIGAGTVLKGVVPPNTVVTQLRKYIMNPIKYSDNN